LEQIQPAITRINNEKLRLQSIAKSTFDTVIQGKPEFFLRAETATEGITLDVMAELYQQARHAGAITTPEVNSAGQLFELCRSKGIAGSSWHRSRKRVRGTTELRYLMASLEEINHIEGMRLLIAEGFKDKESIRDFQFKMKQWWKDKLGRSSKDKPQATAAYGFAKSTER
jgi:hypothetical protein